jgi:hypothetical protein
MKQTGKLKKKLIKRMLDMGFEEDIKKIIAFMTNKNK